MEGGGDSMHTSKDAHIQEVDSKGRDEEVEEAAIRGRGIRGEV